MNVDFNNLRKQAAYSLDKVIKILNAGILSDTEIGFRKSDGKCIRGSVLIDADDLQKAIDSLRENIGVICCVYEEGDDNFRDVRDEEMSDEYPSLGENADAFRKSLKFGDIVRNHRRAVDDPRSDLVVTFRGDWLVSVVTANRMPAQLWCSPDSRLEVIGSVIDPEVRTDEKWRGLFE